MRKLNPGITVVVFLLICFETFAQTDSIHKKNDSINASALINYNMQVVEAEQQRIADSIQKSELESQLELLKTTDNLQKEELIQKLKAIEEKEDQRISDRKKRIDELRETVKGYPVLGLSDDTLFLVYSKIGASTPQERAVSISRKIKKLYQDDFLVVDSISVVKAENTYDIVSGEIIIMSISENDALWHGKSMPELADDIIVIIRNSIIAERKENSILKLFLRVGLVILVLALAWLIFRTIGKGHDRFLEFLASRKEQWFKSFTHKGYTFLSGEQKMQVVLFLVKGLRWFVYALLLYFTLPILFSIFPFSQTWAAALFNLVWSPLKGVLLSVWQYLPKLFSIIVIYFVMRYFIRFVKYLFSEIESGKLKISGFHEDWAMPTFSIVKFLLYAFMFVLIFPLLPNSESNIFKGVSVFIGVLFSLGSTSAISNMVAGLVITYMRPFKIGDRIKIGDVAGDVLEKTLLVTRLKTIKNEIITIPNSAVLSGNTINFSSEAIESGLIVHTTVTIGYDVPWKEMHKALIDAALRTEMILSEPNPFVLQTSLEDFYVSYQINAYTKEASKQALIYSNLHQNIQDVCNERGIEILSPHYQAARDGNMTTIPSDYLPKDYEAPGFNIKVVPDAKTRKPTSNSK